MAFALVGGTVLSSAVQVLLERAMPRADFFIRCFRMSKLRKLGTESVGELRQKLLSHSLISIKQVLDDAADVEDMEVLKPEVRKWLDDLAEVLYDVEDFLDETDGEDLLQVEDFLNEEEATPPQPSPNPSLLRHVFQRLPLMPAPAPYIPNFVQAPPDRPDYPLFQLAPTLHPVARGSPSDPTWMYSPPNAPRVHPMERKMLIWTDTAVGLRKTLDDLLTKMHVLDLKKGAKGKPADTWPTTSIRNEAHLFGRIDELKTILEFPRQNAGNAKKMSVIAIWGMPGVGKTSLVQHVYSDESFNECFDLKAWVYVSNDFNVVRFTKMILEAVSEQRFDTDDLNVLQVTLSTKLSGKRFLLVLDDVWNEKFDSWDVLLKPLKVESKETMVVLTTRHQSVSVSSNADVTLPLDLLSPEDCYTIVKTHATRNRKQVVDEMLDDGCRKIASKCKGLPLAAKAAGRLLCATPREKWKRILETDVWDLPNVITEVHPALMLSYQHLPSNLKSCFSYCSLFPKDYKYDKQKLVLLWIAEGFVRQPENGRSIEEEGEAYFDDLFSRSFFQRYSSNTSYYVMHDLFHDLAQFVSKQFFYRAEHNKIPCRMSSKIRHLSYKRRNCDKLRNLTLESFDRLRTFISIDSEADYFYVSLREMNELVPKLKNVRVLSLSHYQIYHLSASIGDLKHLRFLDVSFTKIQQLPGTICNLSNLQILLLSHCSELTELPPDMHKLTSLWHLDLSGTALDSLPLNMPNISSIRALGKIVSDPSELHKLRDLKHLRGSLCVSISEGMPSLTHGSDSYLQQFEGLQELEINFTFPSHDSDFQAVLSMLEPHCSLQTLSIYGYGGSYFPKWLSCGKFSYMVSLHIVSCEFCLTIPSLGELPSLEHLRLSRFRNVRRVGAEFYGGSSQRITAFKSLKTLMFEYMPEWEEWLSLEGGGCDFRCLKELYVRDCPKLSRQMPSEITSLEKLVISEHPLLNAAPNLEKLVISKCPRLTPPHFLPFILSSETTVPDNVGIIPQISSLELSFLPQLKTLPQEIYLLTALTSLVISNNPNIVSFPDLPFPESLISLRIDECDALSSFPNRLAHIITLVISKCPSLISFPENVVLTSLKILKIKHCKNLHFMSFRDFPTKPNLTTLEIEDSCDSLRYFALNSFTELSHLKISNCENLESLCFLENPKHDLHLLHMYISECTKLREISVPEGGLPAPSLQELTLSRCPSLNSLPQDTFKRLKSLKSLKLDYCPELQPVLEWNNLASGLVSISCTDAIFNSVWLNRQLHHFLALKRMTLDGLKVESFPRCSWVPSRITALTISDFPNLKNIDEGIYRLTSLEDFVIRNCPQVVSIPKYGFPPSLFYLQAIGCPLLEQDMLGAGRIKIAYIPCVIVEYTVI